VAPRKVEVMGIPGTLELRVYDPARAEQPPVLVTLGRHLAREPRDVCFGDWVANQSPEDGDVSCQVRGPEPLMLTLGSGAIPHSSPVARFTTLWGQAATSVTSIALVRSRGQPTPLPLSAHRMFLVAFSPWVRGAFTLVARLAGGGSFGHAFTLPLTRGESGAWPRVSRRGAVSNSGIGENIVQESYRQLVRQFGPPLRSFKRAHGVRCIYYDIVGYANGWEFCFHGQVMTAAQGNTPAP